MLAARIDAFLAGVPDPRRLVGVAYAVDGEVRGARIFASHELWEASRPTLILTLAGEPTTRPHRRDGEGREPATTAAVARFIEDVDRAPVTHERATASDSVLDFSASASAYGSRTLWRAHGSPDPVLISADYLAR